MKVVFLSFSDYKGGAAIAAYNIFNSFKKKNIFFLTASGKYKKSKKINSFLDNIYINILRFIEIILIFIFNKKKYHQSLNLFNTYISKRIQKYNPDIVNIHWVNRSMISLSEISNLNSKIIISLHDMWFLNSTEHYFQIKKNNTSFIDRICWKKKKELIYKKNVFFIAHNDWMKDKFVNLFPSLKKKIFISKYYPIDSNVFKPRNKIELRKKYNLPLNKRIIFFSAQDTNDYRKGYEYFKKILIKLSKNENFYFLSLGKINREFNYSKNYKHINFKDNKETSELYSLSDIFLCTSIIDNLPFTVLEAVSSGNVVISFKNGGSTEVLKDIGYTFSLKNINKLVTFVEKLSNFEIKKRSIKARQFALKNFKTNNSKTQYQKIFNKIYNLKI